MEVEDCFDTTQNDFCVALAEFLIDATPLEWYAFYKKQHNVKGLTRVHIVTDNEVLVKQSKHSRAGHIDKINSNFGLLAMLQELERRGGFLVMFHWKGRDELALNKLADVIAGNARVTMTQLEIVGADQPLVSYAYAVSVGGHELLDKLHRP